MRAFLKLGPAIAALSTILGFGTTPAVAGTAWEDIRASVFGSRPIADGRSVVVLEAPGRPEDMRAAPIAAKVRFEDGRTVKTVTFLIDENPTPVVAEFHMGPGRDEVSLAVNFRVDRQSEVRAVVEASDGALYMVSRLVKYAGGQSSCSAPPSGDPAEIAANMGKMTLTPVAEAQPSSAARPKAQLVLNHPNHTGMVMDQQTLLYTPIRMVSKIAVRQGDDVVFHATGSIGLSQDPNITFDYVRNSANEMTVTFEDTDGGSWTRTLPIQPQS